MTRLAALSLVLFVVVTACGAGSGSASSPSRVGGTPIQSPPISTEWTEYHRDAARSGQGPSDPPLTSPSVAWKASVDGDVYASPLIVGGHVFVATEDNTVYALDLFTGSTIWKTHLGTPVDAASLPCGDIGPITGITGTPAIDAAAGRLYVVAYLRTRHHMLFSLDLVDGSIRSQQDVDPSGSTPAVEQQRGALAIASGYVYVPLGGLYGDCGQYHGYLVAVPLAGGAAFACRVPAAAGAGLWSAMGPTVAANGDVYVVSGNATSGSGFAYSNSVIELSPTLRVKSYFAPSNWASLDASDTDLGSVGATLLPQLGLVVAVGKDGIAYVLRAGRLGGIGGQVASRKVCAGAWGGTAWLGSMVFVPCRDGLAALSVGPASVRLAWSDARPAMASPIVAAGAVWAVDAYSATLYAINPASGAVLYSTRLAHTKHFSSLAATEGFVIAPAGDEIEAILTLGS